MSYGNRLTVTALFATLLCTPAAAADLKGSYGAPETPVDSWEGFYAGVTLGGASSGFTVQGPGKLDQDFTDSGFQVGGMAGYNFTSGPWVWGLEADLSSISLDDDKRTLRGVGTVESDGSLVGSVRLRAGYAWDTLLVYGTAGVAFTDVELKGSGRESANFSTGVALGVGAEWAFDRNWTARIEGMAYGFGEEDATFGDNARDVGFGTATGRLGLARRF
jgi:outer membrane immunogenic protein